MLYAVIIALWICILLPMWLRRHDDALESRSVDRFSSAMRTLSGRGTPDRREVVMPAREQEPVHPDGHARAVAEGRAVLAARRRRTLGLLLGLTLVVTGTVLLGWLPRWGPVLPALLLLGFLVHLRRETKAQAALDRRRRAQAVTAESRRRRASAVPAAVAVEVEHILPPVRETVPAAVAVADADVTAADVELAADELYDAEQDRAWDPVPVPLPTYVTAPKAPRSVRVIDLTKPGLWTSGHLSPDEAERIVAEALADDSAAAAVRHEPTEGDSIVTGEVVIERRRAVND